MLPDLIMCHNLVDVYLVYIQIYNIYIQFNIYFIHKTNKSMNIHADFFVVLSFCLQSQQVLLVCMTFASNLKSFFPEFCSFRNNQKVRIHSSGPQLSDGQVRSCKNTGGKITARCNLSRSRRQPSKKIYFIIQPLSTPTMFTVPYLFQPSWYTQRQSGIALIGRFPYASLGNQQCFDTIRYPSGCQEPILITSVEKDI